MNFLLIVSIFMSCCISLKSHANSVVQESTIHRTRRLAYGEDSLIQISPWLKCESPKYDINPKKMSLKILNKEYINQTSAKVIPMDKDEKSHGFKFSACLIKQFSESAVMNIFVTAKKKNAAPQELTPIMGKFCDFFEKEDMKKLTKSLFYKSSFPVDDKCPWKTGCFEQLKIGVDAHDYPCDLPAESYKVKVLVCEKDCTHTPNQILELIGEAVVKDKAQK